MADANSSRIEALRRSHERRPWTDDLVIERASDPAAFKADFPACEACPAPCESSEVCATAIAKSEGLFEEVSREQAYHLVESAMKRLRSRGTVDYRTDDSERPSAFVALVDEIDELSGRESEPADDKNGRDNNE